jgi:hypothetical protein
MWNYFLLSCSARLSKGTSKFCHFDLSISADDMTLVDTSRKSSLLVSYLVSYLIAVGCNEIFLQRVAKCGDVVMTVTGRQISDQKILP